MGNSRIAGNQIVTDVVNHGGTQGALNVTTSATLAAVGSSNLNQRKILVVYNPITSTENIYWGFSSAVTHLTGFPIEPGSDERFMVGNNLSIYLISQTGTVAVRVGEAL